MSWTLGLAEAARRSVPVLAWAESDWSTASRQFDRRLDRDPVLRAALASQCVLVRIDPVAEPVTTAQLRMAAALLGPAPAGAGPLLLFLAQDGTPLLSHPSFDPEPQGADARHGPLPSLGSQASALAEAHEAEPARLREEARALLASGTAPKPPPVLDPQPEWVQLELDRIEVGEGDRAGLVATLDALLASAQQDPLDGGFHRGTRDPHRFVPLFEKPIALSAEWALALRRAALLLHRPGFDAAAAAAARFALREGRDRRNRLVGAIAADAGFHTWTARELHEAVDPQHIQPLDLHFHITPAPVRHALRPVLTPEAMGRYVHTDPALLRERIEAGKRAMLAARATRPAPRRIEAETSFWRATLLGLRLRLTFAGWQEGDAARDAADLMAEAQALLGAPEPTLGDCAAILDALLELDSGPARDRRGVDQAIRAIASMLVRRHFDPATGMLGERGRRFEPSTDLTCGLLPASVPLAIGALLEAGGVIGRPDWIDAARHAALVHAPLARRLGLAAVPRFARLLRRL